MDLGSLEGVIVLEAAFATTPGRAWRATTAARVLYITKDLFSAFEPAYTKVRCGKFEVGTDLPAEQLEAEPDTGVRCTVVCITRNDRVLQKPCRCGELWPQRGCIRAIRLHRCGLWSQTFLQRWRREGLKLKQTASERQSNSLMPHY